MNKKVIGALGVVLSAGVVVSGAACWRTLRNGMFTDSACTGDSFSLTGAFLPAYDFAELRETGFEPTFRVLQSAGKRCATATSVETCEAALAAATSTRGWRNGSHGRMPGHQYLVVSKGDTVQVINGEEVKLGAALAPIDSVVKAAAVASQDRNLGIGCGKAVRKVDTGYEVHLSTDSCFGPRDEVIGVAVDGATTVISSESGPSTCVGQGPARNARHIEAKYAAVTPAK